VARDVFGYNDEDLADIAAAGVRSSFADDDVKRRMVRDIDSWRAEP
jgi:adenosine deaminase